MALQAKTIDLRQARQEESVVQPYADVAVVVPCYNEELSVGTVVADARRFLPGATVYVYDNNSSDRTREVARQAGAVVRSEKRQGKGYAIRRAFSDVTEKVIIMIDGDDTYDLSAAPAAVGHFRDNKLDYLNIKRLATGKAAYRPGHVLGNRMLTGAIRMIFGRQVKDMLSGYKVLSNRFVRSFPISSAGFEIETELLVHALELGVAVDEIDAPYKERPEGSVSKLSTFRDGFRIAWTILRLMQAEKPLAFFSILSLLSAMLSLGLGSIVVSEFLRTGLVDRFPTAILAGLLGVIAVLLVSVGLTLDLVQRTRSDVKKIAFLALSRE